MAEILQIDVITYSGVILAAILGFISASAVDYVKDCINRRRLRDLIYNEIIECI